MMNSLSVCFCSTLLRNYSSRDYSVDLESRCAVWHDCTMLRLLLILVQLAADVVRWCGLVLRSQRSIEAQNLFLRRQLALYVERGVEPRRIDSATRVALAFLSGIFHWRDALVVVRRKR